LVKIFKISPKKIEIIPPGIEVEKPSLKIQDKLRKKYKLLAKKVILFTGRILPEKNPQLLIKALPKIKEEIKNIKIVFVGPVEKGFREKLLELAGENSQDIIFAGPFHPIKEATTLANLYALSDVFVALGEWEGVPLRILEARAYGLPIAEGILNPEKLAQKISEILISKKRPQYFRNLKSHFWPNVLDKIYRVYKV